MKPEIAVFTKTKPCTKLHIWNTFRDKRGFCKVQVNEAHSRIGINTPRNLIKKERAKLIETSQAEYYILSDSGKKWLTAGVLAYMKNHPDSAEKVRNPPKT